MYTLAVAIHVTIYKLLVHCIIGIKKELGSAFLRPLTVVKSCYTVYTISITERNDTYYTRDDSMQSVYTIQ